MVRHGLISEEFSQSGALEAFSIDRTLGRDALPHILIGDEYGGTHHLPTIIGLGIDGRQIASTVINPNNPNKKRSDYRAAQKIQENGVYEARIVKITDGTGQVMEKAKGSSFFPNEWTTQDVLEAVISVSQQPGEHHPTRRAFTHTAKIKGVTVIVNTDDLTGKIVAARPGRK